MEGVDDKHAVIGLMRRHIDWPDTPSGWPVYIKVGNSNDEILAQGYLSTQIKASTVRTVGVLLDADLNSGGRYQRIQQLCKPLFPDLPPDMPAEGLFVDNPDGKRLGLWLMPDNMSPGGLETFLRLLVPDSAEGLWTLACSSVANARSMGAACREAHIQKANLSTWLAWHDPPGQSPGLALTRKILDPESPHAAGFVSWFRTLFEV